MPSPWLILQEIDIESLAWDGLVNILLDGAVAGEIVICSLGLAGTVGIFKRVSTPGGLTL